MKNTLILLLLLFPILAFAQYPATGNKMRLGWQTTGDGLVYRDAGAPSYTPNSRNNAYMYLDTVAQRLYRYTGGAWRDLSDEKYMPIQNSSVLAADVKDTLTIYDRLFVAMELTSAVGGNRGVQLPVTGLDSTYAGRVVRVSPLDSSATYNVFVSSSSPDGLLVDGSLQTSYDLEIDETVEFQLYVFDTIYQWRLIHTSKTNDVVLPDSLIYGKGDPDWVAVFSPNDSTIKAGNIRDDGTDITFALPEVAYGIDDTSTPDAGTYGYNGATGRFAYYNAGWRNLISGNVTQNYLMRADANGNAVNAGIVDDGTFLQLDRPTAFKAYTTTGLPTGVENRLVWDSTLKGVAAYNGTRWGYMAYSLQPTLPGGIVAVTTSSGLLAWDVLYWDASNNRLGINIASPLYDQHIYSTANNLTYLNVQNATNNTSVRAGFGAETGSGTSYRATAFQQFAPAYTNSIWGGSYIAGNSLWGLATLNDTTNNFSTFAIATHSSANPATYTGGYRWNIAIGNTELSTSNELMRLNLRGLGIKTTNPARALHVAGEVRITDLTTDPPTRIVGADADGDLGAVTVGSGLSLSPSGILSATASSYTGFTPAADSGTGSNVASGGTLTISGGYGINTSVSGTTMTTEVDTAQIPTQYDLSLKQDQLTTGSFGQKYYYDGDNNPSLTYSNFNTSNALKLANNIGLQGRYISQGNWYTGSFESFQNHYAFNAESTANNGNYFKLAAARLIGDTTLAPVNTNDAQFGQSYSLSAYVSSPPAFNNGFYDYISIGSGRLDSVVSDKVYADFDILQTLRSVGKQSIISSDWQTRRLTFGQYGDGDHTASSAEISAGYVPIFISGTGEIKEAQVSALPEKQSFTVTIYDGDTALPDSSTAAGGLILNRGFFRVPERMDGWDLNVSFGIFDFGTLTSTHTYSVSLTICDGDNANCTNGATANFTLSSERELSPATTFTVDANDIVRVAVTAPSGCDCGTESVNGLTAVYTLTSN